MRQPAIADFNLTVVRDVARQIDPRATTRPDTWRIAPLAYPNLDPAARGLFRVGGASERAADGPPWSAILKTLRAPGDPRDAAGHPYWWRREAELFRAGVPPHVGPFAAPRCYAVEERPDGAVWLWLEDLGADDTRWSVERFGLAAEQLGRFQGGAQAAGTALDSPHLSRGLLRAWMADAAPLLPRLGEPGVWSLPPLRDAFPANPAAEVLALWDERERWARAIERRPQVLSHHDLWRRNLFARDGDGAARTVAIDWELAGPGAPGEDAGNLLGSALLNLDIEVVAAGALRDAIVGGYLRGLGAAGWAGDTDVVRRTILAAAALRTLFSAAGWPVAIAADRSGRHATETERRWGRPLAAILRQWAGTTAFLLDAAREARPLLAGAWPGRSRWREWAEPVGPVARATEGGRW